MGHVRVRRSRLSPLASVLMILVGVLAFLEVNAYAGLILIVLGIVMYVAYRRLSKRSQSSERITDGMAH